MQPMISEVASIILWMNDGRRDEGLGCESKKCQSAENHNRAVLAGEWDGWREMVWPCGGKWFGGKFSATKATHRAAGGRRAALPIKSA